MTVKPSIPLTDQQDAFARELVRQGLDLLRQQTEGQEAETEALRTLAAYGGHSHRRRDPAPRPAYACSM